MSKINLIIKREYTTRVMKKSFILLTFLTPVLMVGMISLIVYLGTIKDNKVKSIVVVDKTGLYKDVLKNNESYTFRFTDATVDELKKQEEQESDFAAVLYISDDLSKNASGATMYSEKQVNLELKTYVAGLLNKHIEEQKLASYNIPNLKEMVEKSKTDIDMKTIKWSEDGKDKEASAELAILIGMITAFIIYMFIVIYGAQVMSGVVQEKTNRIVEVMISSVKPFELMMGKIIGIALVGLTQVLLWVLLTVAIGAGVTTFMGGDIDPASIQKMQDMQQMGQMNMSAGVNGEIADFMSSVAGLNFTQLIILFVVYFLGGYLLYASLFAAIGSAVDNETDTNQFSLPVMIPIIFAIYAGIFAAENPDGPLAFWCSMIPFTSPIVMMVRLPFDVPAWELALSISILVLSFIGTTWMAGKIYRTGILMYGKKITWGEMWKWLKY
ncbi:MAG: ABC transporter permease [Paludibacteraceae bacterium]|nr:ABC transporter permease [Paludibacteraceae bacterium]